MLSLADSTTAVVAISMLGRFFVTFSVNTVMQQTYEIMPTELRAQGVSLSRCLSQFARIFSSYVVFSVREERFQSIIRGEKSHFLFREAQIPPFPSTFLAPVAYSRAC